MTSSTGEHLDRLNDRQTQCNSAVNDFKCIPLDFPTGTAHGHYCLRSFPPACDQPFAVTVANRVSISGALSDSYCAVNEDLTTCEAARAFNDNWHCTGTPGMCSELLGGTEIAVPGAICADLGGGAQTSRCTYECSAADQCLLTAPRNTCDDNNGTAPADYCGGIP